MYLRIFLDQILSNDGLVLNDLCLRMDLYMYIVQVVTPTTKNNNWQANKYLFSDPLQKMVADSCSRKGKVGPC